MVHPMPEIIRSLVARPLVTARPAALNQMKRFLFSTALALVLVLESRGAGSRALITDKTTGELKFADPANEAQFIDLATNQFKFNHTILNFGNAANKVPILDG